MSSKEQLNEFVKSILTTDKEANMNKMTKHTCGENAWSLNLMIHIYRKLNTIIQATEEPPNIQNKEKIITCFGETIF